MASSLRRAFVAASIAWAVALPLAAAAAATSHPARGEFAFAFSMYALGTVLCHQRPERSFQIWGVQLPVCARCTGIYLGAALSSAFAARRLADLKSARRPKIIVLAAGLPIALTLVFEWTTGAAPSNWIRALSGIPAGAAVAWLVLTDW